MSHNVWTILFAGFMNSNPQAAVPSQPADILIRNAHLVTMNAEREIIPSGVLVIRGSEILAVGGRELEALYSASSVIDASGDIVMPGMVNTHCHAAMTLFRGLGDDIPDRLNRFIFPLERKVVDRDNVYWGSLLAAAEMVMGGVTTFADMYYFEGEVARAAKEIGMRGVLGETVIGHPSPDAVEPYGGLEVALEFIERFKNDELVSPALAPHAPYTLDSPHLREVARLGCKLGVPILTHLSETEAETDQIRREFEMTPAEYLDSVGLLNPRLVAAHCIFVTDTDMNLLKRRGVGISHNIVSNIKAGKGVAPVLEMLDKGLEVGLGTDGPMSGNTLDIITQMGYVAKIHRLMARDRRVMPAETVVEMATMGGARALHMGDRIGSLEVGKLADVVIVDKDAVNMIPMYDPYPALAYAAAAGNVTTTIVHGRILMEGGRLLTVDIEKIKREVLALTEKIKEEAAKL